MEMKKKAALPAKKGKPCKKTVIMLTEYQKNVFIIVNCLEASDIF